MTRRAREQNVEPLDVDRLTRILRRERITRDQTAVDDRSPAVVEPLGIERHRLIDDWLNAQHLPDDVRRASRDLLVLTRRRREYPDEADVFDPRRIAQARGTLRRWRSHANLPPDLNNAIVRLVAAARPRREEP